MDSWLGFGYRHRQRRDTADTDRGDGEHAHLPTCTPAARPRPRDNARVGDRIEVGGLGRGNAAVVGAATGLVPWRV